MPNNPSRLKLDGPSLVLLSPGLSPQRYPLRRISHLVLGGALMVELDAISACLRRSISLSFLDGVGLSGIALPSRPQQRSAEQRIEDFLSKPNWNTQYADWLRSMERSRLLLMLKQMRWEPSALSGAVIRTAWAQRMARFGITPGELDSWVTFDHSLLAARCAHFLSKAGLDPLTLAAGPVLAPRTSNCAYERCFCHLGCVPGLA